MRTSEAARYARWAARVAILLTVGVAGVYGYRAWQAARVRQQAPPVVPVTVQKRSAEFSFSKVEGERTLFTVRASRATEFKAGSKSLLEDVWITIYGHAGRRFDNIHTRSCDYEPATGRIICAGEVQIDLESAEEARERPGQRVIQVRTAKIHFDRESGQARTDQPVVFRFPYGEGRGRGVTYSTREALIRVHGAVEVTLSQANRPAGGPAENVRGSWEPVVLTGACLEYHRDTHRLRLLPPVRVRQGTRELTAGHLALELDADLRARRLVAGRGPMLRLTPPSGAGGETILTAEEFVVFFSPEGWAARVLAQGQARGRQKSTAGESSFEAQRLELELEPGGNAPRRLNASGAVKVESRADALGASRRLETDALQAGFAPAARRAARRVEHVETLAAGRLEIASSSEVLRIQGERLRAEFDEANHIQRLTGNSGVEIERRLAKGAPQVTLSDDLAVTFSGGEWTRMEQSGNVRFREGERSTRADRGVLARAEDTLTLTGSASVADPLTRTTAEALSIHLRTGEVHGQGGVRTTYRAAEGSGVSNLGPQPAHIASEELRAQRETGRAVYSGHARLWQGDAVIEGDAIELLRDPPRLEARGDVLGLFPQLEDAPRSVGSPPATTERMFWKFRAASFTYWGGEGRAQLEGGVSAESRLGQITGRRMELYFERAAAGPQRLARALAAGNVVVRQGERRGTAETAEYFVGEGKFVLSGGRPTLFDANRGATSGRQLTFFLADDKIVVDSEEGSRTLTRHRVEK